MQYFAKLICIRNEGEKEGENLRSNAEVQRVVETYASTLLRVAFSQMKSMSDAEDMVQEALLKYMEKAPEFETLEHEKAWLIRVTINLCRNRRNTAWFKKTVPLDESIPALESGESVVLGAVLALPKKYRTVIHLYYYEGYPVAEIAKILNRNPNTVVSQLSRARGLLKKSLKEDFDE